MLWVLSGTPVSPDPRAGTQNQPGPTWSTRAVHRRGGSGDACPVPALAVPECLGIHPENPVSRGHRAAAVCRDSRPAQPSGPAPRDPLCPPAPRGPPVPPSPLRVLSQGLPHSAESAHCS